ncbi:hypothetical protein TNCT_728981 [Trichonephila clavata]|uniref:Uncharacterized protein n=1 Tax=Trichonephila clavata TaxID=2740835 RepID=A0A8X6JLS8_TRICU|nr:hypothetical protein TNCT_728981 [Trichonephila clavata]
MFSQDLADHPFRREDRRVLESFESKSYGIGGKNCVRNSKKPLDATSVRGHIIENFNIMVYMPKVLLLNQTVPQPMPSTAYKMDRSGQH